MKKTLRFLVLISILFCSQPKPELDEAQQEKLKNQKFFTKEDPGIWQGYENDHVPEVKWIKKNTVKVDVPF